jgi:hypothetical protein
MSRERRSISDRLIERIALDELPEQELEALRAKLLSTPEWRARLEALEQSDAEIRAAYPTSEMMPEIERRMHRARVADAASKTRGVTRLVAWAAPALAAAAVAVFALVTPTDGQLDGLHTEGSSGIELERLKGDLLLVIQRKRGDETVTLTPTDARARAGDRLQLAYRVAGEIYGVIMSLDGRGTVTTHLANGKLAAKMDAGELTALEFSYELDDAPRCERFFLVTGPEPFPVDDVQTALRALFAKGADRATSEEPSLPEPLRFVSFVVWKD